MERSSGDSDGQGPDGPELKHLEVQDNVSLSHSGMEADSESQGSHDSKADVVLGDNVNADSSVAVKSISENQVGFLLFLFFFYFSVCVNFVNLDFKIHLMQLQL